MKGLLFRGRCDSADGRFSAALAFSFGGGGGGGGVRGGVVKHQFSISGACMLFTWDVVSGVGREMEGLWMWPRVRGLAAAAAVDMLKVRERC
jgi:hypothetical protein